jgi:hypothetical protein
VGVSITQGFTLFRNAWIIAFTAKNIKKSFESTGIWPLNQEKTLRKLPIPLEMLKTSTPLAIRTTATPLTCQGARRLVSATPTLERVAQMQKVAMKLATHFELQKHENRNLLRAIGYEKKKRQRNKRLNLTSEEGLGVAQIFSPTRVLTAKEYQESKEAVEQEEIRQKALQKAEKGCARIQKLAEKEEAKLQKEMVQVFKKEQKEAEQARKKAAVEQRQLNHTVVKQAKEQAASPKKLEDVKRKETAGADAAADGQKRVKKGTPNAPKKKAARKAPNPRKNAAV